MKIKVRPEDFIVRELADVPLVSSGGTHVLLRVTKDGLSTMEAVQTIARAWRIPASRIHVGGQKDKYGRTEQLMTIDTEGGRIALPLRGDRPDAEIGGRARITLVGRIDRPMGPDLLRGNRFEIVVRDIPPLETEKLSNAYIEVLNCGFVNYFGEQRFGSARHGRGFFARELLRGREEPALKLFLAATSRKDRSRLKAFKKRIGAHWGDWDACLENAPQSPERKLILYLRNHPEDFRGAVQQIPRPFLSLLLAAYQSHLWNETVRRYLQAAYGSRVRLFPFQNEHVRWLFYRAMPDSVFEEMRLVTIPLVDRRVEYVDPVVGGIVSILLREEGVERKSFALRWLRGAFFKSAERKMVVVPEDFEIDPPVPDDAYEGRRKISLRFTLPPGSYATVLLRRMMM